MTTIDLNTEQKWDEVFRRVEAGEVLRVTRGDREVALIQPAEVIGEDEADLDALARQGAKQLSETLPPGEFAQWAKDIGKKGS